jgi:Na+/melibiose symporter-like transporter
MSGEPRSIGRDRGLTLAYCAAHFGKSLFWNCGTLLLAFFLTEAAGLPPMVMGAVLAGGLLLSGATDVVIGRAMRERLSCTRSAAGLQAWGCVFASLALLGLFMAPLAPDGVRLGWVIATLLAFRVAYSVYDTPQNALMTLATTDAWSRSRVAALRVATSGLAALLLAAAILPFLASDAFSGTERRAALFVWLGVAMTAIGLGTAVWLRHALSGREAGAPPSSEPPVPGGAGDWPAIVALAPLYGMAFAFPLGMSAFAKLEPYYVTYVIASPVWAGALAIAGSCGVLLSQLAWERVLRRLERRRAFAILSLALLVSALAFGLAARTPWAAAAAAGLIGVASGGLNQLIWSTVAEEAATRGRAQVGLIYGVFTAVSKAAPALGGLGLGALLGRFDYREAGADGLILLITGFPMLGAATCAVIALSWRARRAA